MIQDRAHAEIHALLYEDETSLVRRLVDEVGFSADERASIAARAAELVREVRREGRLGLMESFLSEYGLDSEEGVALMSLAEALLRVPDSDTVDALIHDKVSGADWASHFGSSENQLVNFSSWALNLAVDVLGEPIVGPKNALHRAVARLGEPVIRTAVAQAMRILGSQFVFGRSIDEAIRNAKKSESVGYRYSYDMLGEAARTGADAQRYFDAYSDAITRLAPHCTGKVVRDNPGISVKLSALHPRYEVGQRERVMTELVDATHRLAIAAAKANMGFNIDAEEVDRLDLSLDVIEGVLASPELAGWDGFGVVVQAYGKRVLPLIDWLDATAEKLGRRIMVRLVKGAYWDAEIKRAQVMGLPAFSVFTRRPRRMSATSPPRESCSRPKTSIRSLPATMPIRLRACSISLNRRDAERTRSNSSACMAWASNCTRRCAASMGLRRAFMRQLGRIRTFSPIWCAAFSKTAPMARLSIRSPTSMCRPRSLPKTQSARCWRSAKTSPTRPFRRR